jgi:hypothetical protein
MGCVYGHGDEYLGGLWGKVEEKGEIGGEGIEKRREEERE